MPAKTSSSGCYMYKSIPKYEGPVVELNVGRLSSMETAMAADAAAVKFNAEMAEVRAYNQAVYAEWVKSVKASAAQFGGAKLLTDAWFNKYRQAIGYPWSSSRPANKVEMLTKILDDIQIKKLVREQEAEAELAANADIMAAAKKFDLERQPGESPDAFSERVWECAREAYCAENFADGDEIEISCCNECSTWTVGERRCSCGNVRVELAIEACNDKFISKGFYGYGERY